MPQGETFFVAVTGAHADKSLLTWGVTIGSLIGIFSVPLTGALSDRWGRRRVYRIGSVFLLLYSFPAWWMLTLGNHALAIAVIAVGIGFAVNVMLGPQCAMLPEMFGNRHRYLGVAMAREISAVLADGLVAYLIAVSGTCDATARRCARSKTPMRHTPPGGSPPTSRPRGR